MKKKVDYLLIGTGIAPLLAAQRLSNRGESVAVLNPDRDFFLENSELPLDLLNFETTTADLSSRFSNNSGEQVYRDLISEFPGAIETWKEEDEMIARRPFQVESAPWIRLRHRLWVAREGTKRAAHLENLYLRSLDLGAKPQWLEGLSLAKRFPGVAVKNFEQRTSEKWVGFLGPRFGDVDIDRYRIGLLEIVRERLGRDNLMSSAHFLGADTKSVRFQLASGLPQSIEVGRSLVIFWTPKLERFLSQIIEKNQPRMLNEFQQSVSTQRYEEWDILSRDAISPYVVGHFGGIRVWSQGEGIPPVGGWKTLKVMRKEETGSRFLSAESFDDLSKMILNFMGWQNYTVKKVNPRLIYRWNQTQPLQFDVGGLNSHVIRACDGPIHWIAKKVRQTIDGI